MGLLNISLPWHVNAPGKGTARIRAKLYAKGLAHPEGGGPP